MADQPTILIGSLNDAELKQSIDKLVEHVNTATKTMVTNFDQAINEMKRKLQDFGNTTINSSGTADGGSSRRASSQAKEKQAVQETTLTYDQQAQTLQKVVNQQQNYSAEIKKAADAIRQSTSWQETGIATVGRAVVYKKDELSIEEQLVQAQKKYGDEVFKTAQNIDNQTASVRQFGGEVKVANDNAINMHQQTMRSREIMAQGAMQSVTQSYDQLSQTIMRTLGISRDELVVIENEQYSYNALAAQLKQMNQAYAELTTTERSSDSGRELAQNIQTASRELQKIQNEKMRPQSLQQAMGLDEHTLDDISYKIKQLQMYQNGLNLDSAKGRQEYQATGQAIDDLKKRQDKLMGSQRGLIQGNNALTRSFNYMKNRLAFMFTVGGTTQFVKQLAEVRGEYEMTERALGVLVDSAQRGTQIFNQLSQMALVSPYTLIELSNAAKQLVAYDVAAKDVVDTTRRLADISAAVGAPVERLTYALGQIKAYEYLNSRDARIFANAGIPLVKQLSEYYTKLEGRLVSVGDVYDRIKKKAVSYSDVMGVINRMTDEGGRFFDYQAKVADTLKVQLANLTLAWNNMLNQIGKEESGLLTGSVKTLKNMFIQWKNIDHAVGNIIWSYGIMKGLQLIILQFEKAITNEKARELLLNEQLVKSYDKLRGKVANTAKSGYTWITMALLLVTSVIRAIGQARQEVREFNKAISEGAKEASKNLSEFLQSASASETRALALDKALTPTNATKAWETIREEIENSSMAADLLIPQLMQIEDVNERVAAAFNMADKIRDAQNALDDLYEEMNVRDAGFFESVFIGTDRMSAAQLVDLYTKQVKYREKHPDKALRQINVERTREYAYNSVSAFVNDAATLIRDRLKGAAANDPVVVTEAWTRILEEFYATYPDMTKDARETFTEWANKMFSDEFGDAYDTAALAQKKFFDLLKKNSSTTFANIYEGFIDEQGGLNPEQQKAIDDAAEKLGEEWKTVFWQSMNNQDGKFDSHKFERYLLSMFDGVDRNAIQKEFDQKVAPKFDEKGKGVYNTLRLKDTEDTVAWEKRLADEEEAYTKSLEQANEMLKNRANYQSDTIVQMESQKTEAQDYLAAIKRIQEYFNLRNKEELDAAKKSAKREDILSDALKDEIRLVSELQKRYKERVEAGYNSTTALNDATKEYNESLSKVNANLKRFGFETLSPMQLATMPMTQVRDFYQRQLAQALTSDVKPDAIEALEKAIAALNVDADKNDMSARIQFMHDMIDGTKDMYELAKEMKDNPALSDVFADMMGLSQENIDELPKNAEQVIDRLNKLLQTWGYDAKAQKVPNLMDVLNVANLEQFIRDNNIDGEFEKVLREAVKIANDIRLDEAKAQIDDWNKLLEKYAEYEYKRTEIIKQAQREREAARANGASQDIFDAIDRGERMQLASLDFEQFQKSNMWLTATGDLATLTDDALRGLINTLDEYKDKAQDLDPKDIKSINSALRKMHKELRKGNPFTAIIETIQDAKDRAADFQDEINETEQAIVEMYAKLAMNGGGTDEDYDKLARLEDKLSKLKLLFKDVSQISPTALVSGINDAIGVARTATNEFKELADALGGDGMTRAAENIEHATNILESAGQGAAVGAQLGGGWGALIGAVAGGLKGVIVEFADEWSGNAGITRQIQESQRQVTLLGQRYDELAWEADKAYGVMSSGLRGVTAENKKLQLAELERQLTLEQSRKAKNKDEDEIIRLKGEIAGLRREIVDTTNDAINELLGISDWGRQIESLIEVMINAFRNGEDAMQAFSDKWDEMIDNIILKLIVSKFVEQAWDEISQTIDKKREEMTQAAEADKAKNEKLKTDTSAAWEQWLEDTGKKWDIVDYESNQALFDEFSKNYESWLAQREADNEDAFRQSEIDYAEWLKEYLKGEAKDSIMGKLEPVMDYIKGEYTYGENGAKQLSLLQQGIQGITEETAGALEAYMNGVSQQVYLHSDLLTQIRDAVVGFDLDLQTSVQAQMLLQLQNQYVIMQAIQGMMEGWSIPSGQGIRVEMIS